MKNLSLALNAVLIVAVGILYYLHFAAIPPQPAQNIDATDTSGLVQPTLEPMFLPNASARIAYVNTDSLLEKYEYFKKMKAQLEAKGRKAEAELGGRLRNLEQEFIVAQQKAQTGKMSQQQMQETEQQLVRKQQELSRYKDEQGQKMMEEERKMNKELYDNIHGFFKVYGKKQGYDFVLGYTKGGGILYAKDSLEITTNAIKGLNAFYKQNKK